jgi:hypothetical protein
LIASSRTPADPGRRGPEERVGAGVEGERDAGGLPRGDGGLDGLHRLEQRLELVLAVGADDADVAGDRAARVAVAGLEVSSCGCCTTQRRRRQPSREMDHSRE